MAKRKISFDISLQDFEKIKTLVQSSYLVQGDFLRQAVHHALEEFNDAILTVYIIENNTLTRKVIAKSEYTIELDESSLSKELIEDFSFIKSGFLIRNGVKTRFYTKTNI